MYMIWYFSGKSNLLSRRAARKNADLVRATNRIEQILVWRIKFRMSPERLSGQWDLQPLWIVGSNKRWTNRLIRSVFYSCGYYIALNRLIQKEIYVADVERVPQGLLCFLLFLKSCRSLPYNEFGVSKSIWTEYLYESLLNISAETFTSKWRR